MTGAIWSSERNRIRTNMDPRRDLMKLERIDTAVNDADHLTKLLERTLFYWHVDHIMDTYCLHIPLVMTW